MYTEAQIHEYLAEIRKHVCSRCVERPLGGPPCAPLGKMCGIEFHLPKYLEAVHQADSPMIQPYLDKINQHVCNECPRLDCDGCPCPLDYLAVLLMQAVDTVDQRHAKEAAFQTAPATI